MIYVRLLLLYSRPVNNLTNDMIRRNRFFVLLMMTANCILNAQERIVELTDVEESCTSIAVGKKASADGSVITSQTCDGTSRTWMEFVPAQQWPDSTTIPILWDMRHTESKNDRLGVREKGTIPQVASTYAFLNTGYPCMNEKQLAMGETTIVGRADLRSPKGLFHIEDLQAIALQRCSTARDAIRVMGDLVEQYGYCDGGECLTIADKNELWFFEITGEGKDRIGGLWVAQRIPEDHVCVSANTPRISTVDFNDSENFMFARELREKTKEMGLLHGPSPF